MLALNELSPLPNQAGSRTQKSKEAHRLEESSPVPQVASAPSPCVTAVKGVSLCWAEYFRARAQKVLVGGGTHSSEFGTMPVSVRSQAKDAKDVLCIYKWWWRKKQEKLMIHEDEM